VFFLEEEIPLSVRKRHRVRLMRLARRRNFLRLAAAGIIVPSEAAAAIGSVETTEDNTVEVKLEADRYTIPGWVDEFVEKRYLKELDKKAVEGDEGDPKARGPSDVKHRLYNVGRATLEELQPLKEPTVPEQLPDGRYRKDLPADWGGDELMFHIRDVQQVQELLSNVLRHRPKRPFTFLPVWTPQEIEQRIRARKWNSTAWGAGSHSGCDIYVLYMNVQMGLEKYRPAYEAAMATVTALQNAEDGMWGGRQNEAFDRVNATMKLFSKVHFVQECHLPFADKVIDYVLDYCQNVYPTYLSVQDSSCLACSMIDIMFCLKYAVRMTDHRRNDVAETVYGLFPLMEQLSKRDDSSIMLMLGSIRRAALLCGLKDELGWPEKVYRFPAA